MAAVVVRPLSSLGLNTLLGEIIGRVEHPSFSVGGGLPAPASPPVSAPAYASASALILDWSGAAKEPPPCPAPLSRLQRPSTPTLALPSPASTFVACTAAAAANFDRSEKRRVFLYSQLNDI